MVRKLAYFFLLSLFVFNCTGKPAPVQVNGELTFGQYIISPPKGYWYFPRKFPAKLRTSNDIFLVTFWEDKESVSRKVVPNKTGVFFNFAVSANTYKNFEAYYDAARTLGITYGELPNEAEMLRTMTNWNCKQTGQGVYGIECISLRDHIVIIGAYGNNKGEVLSKIPALKQMIGSLKMKTTKWNNDH
ncbi:MAG: hypothetical protein M1353_12780 [Nitrospirae bacterium]|nr:hypothetical protein [Nitrospirota bacterium]